MSLVADLHRRFATLIAELTRFGLIGTLGLIIDLGGAALLHGRAGFGPLMAKAISASVATVVSYTGHRLWTFRHRASQSIPRGGMIFFGLNMIGLIISLVVIALVTGPLGQHSLAAYNAAQVIGVLLGMLFRYWSYRRWVFLAFEPGETALRHGPAALELALRLPGGTAGPATGKSAAGGQVPAPERMMTERAVPERTVGRLRAERLAAEYLRAERQAADRLRAERLRTDQA